MLLDDDVVTDGQPKPDPFSSGFGRKEGSEQPFLHIGRNAGAVVADPDLHAVSEVLGRGRKRWLVVAAIRFRFALGRCVAPAAPAPRRARAFGGRVVPVDRQWTPVQSARCVPRACSRSDPSPAVRFHRVAACRPLLAGAARHGEVEAF
jgi:hypothetical protein